MNQIGNSNPKSTSPKPISRPLALAISFAIAGTLSTNAVANTYIVTNTADSGPGTLRQALLDANANAGSDDIVFSVMSGSTINLLSGLYITDEVTIIGPTVGDPSSITLNAGGNSRHIRALNFYYAQTKSLTLENITLTNGDSSAGPYVGNGGAITSYNMGLNLSHTIITGNSSPSAGGGVYVSSSDLALDNSTVSNNTAIYHGGGFSVNTGDATLTLSNVTANSTSADYSPGGGFHVNGNLNLSSSNITGNSTSGNGSGGGGGTINGNTILTSSFVTGNSTTGNNSSGGGLYVSETTTLNSSTISGNSTAADNANGGGLFSSQNVTLTQSAITGNSTAGSYTSGGGLHTFGTVNLNQSDISNNVMTGSSSRGGGILASGTATLNNSTVTGNSLSATAGNNTGGGLYAYNGVSLSFSSITGNTITTGTGTSDSARGGGFVSSSGTNSIIYSNILNNSIVGGYVNRGGGLSVSGGPTTITDSTISNNSVTGNFIYGAGASIDGVSTLTRSTFSGNTSIGDGASGGGLHNTYGHMTLNQCTVSGNMVTGNHAKGGGIFVNGQLTVNQSTIVGNSSTHEAGGISLGSGYSHILSNSILSGNSGPNDNFVERFTLSTSDSVTITNTLFGDTAAEITNLASADNQISNLPNLGPLQDNGGSTFTHLPNLSSLAIDNGNNAAAAPFVTDQRSGIFPRIVQGFVDIGSVESSGRNQGDVVTRSEILKPILQAVLGVGFNPDPASGIPFTDVADTSFNADWIEKFLADGYTEGCAANMFCPQDIVTKEQLAKFIIKAKKGTGYTPITATGIYTDVPVGSFNADWIEALNIGSMTTGCATGRFCPKAAVTVEVFENIINAAFP